MTRKECLEQAMECVLQDRNSQYGEPEDSFGMIAGMWTAYLGVAVDKVDVAMMMGMLKMARIRGNKHYGDGYIDLAGYAACAAECSGIGTEVPPWAKLAMADAKEVEEAFGKPDSGCFPNGKDHANPRVVEWVNKWNEERKREEANPLFFERQARVFAENNPPEEPEDNHPENPDTSPEFKSRDKVQARLGDGVWRDAVVTGKEIIFGKLYYTVKVADFNGYYNLHADDVRPVPKAEGCEELVSRHAIYGEKKEQN